MAKDARKYRDQFAGDSANAGAGKFPLKFPSRKASRAGVVKETLAART
jgi:hypothetical protein